MFKLKFGSYVKPVPSAPLSSLALTLSDVDFCYAVLNSVSRSFAVVIQQLPPQLRDPVCIFYLVLRGLDSVEDDMTYPVQLKLPLLCAFHTKLAQPDWRVDGVGDTPEYRVLLAHFDKVIRVYRALDRSYQAVISDITRKMGEGMAEFADKGDTSIDSIAHYNLYCHYVAGLVGHGLSRLWSSSGLEDADLQLQERLSNSMGLFLQKTNIIRDYLEDLQAGRTWWPREIWGQYAPSLTHFAAHPRSSASLQCLDHMVNDALSHVPDCLDYLSRLRNKAIFEFCAIPQTMAIATLCEVYRNSDVFERNVKVRKGMAAKMMLESGTLIQVHNWFRSFAEELEHKMPKEGAEEEGEVLGWEGGQVNGHASGGGVAEGEEEEKKGGGVGAVAPAKSVRTPGAGKEEKTAAGNGHTNGYSTHPCPSPFPSTSATTTRLFHDDPTSTTLNRSRTRTAQLLAQIEALTRPGHHSPKSMSYLNVCVWVVFLVATGYLLNRLRGGSQDERGGKGGHYVGGGPGFGLMNSGLDVMAVLVGFVSVGYLFGFFGIQYV